MLRAILGCKRSEVTNERFVLFIKYNINQTKQKGMGLACNTHGRMINTFLTLFRKFKVRYREYMRRQY
jgi:hypothetical protein